MSDHFYLKITARSTRRKRKPESEKHDNGVSENETSSSFIIDIFTKAIEHSENWGKVWFGLIFIGSILNATAVKFFPDSTGGRFT